MKDFLSFGDWCVKNEHEDYLDLWDYELNKKSPFDIKWNTYTRFLFKCENGMDHDSDSKQIFAITSRGMPKCKLCNSFYQWAIDNYGKEFFEKYWDREKNEGIDPRKLTRRCGTKIWIKCQEKDYHGSY